MAGGLLGQAAGQGAGVMTANFNGEEEAEQEPNVAPEEQEQYDQFVKNGMELLYTPDGKLLPDAQKRLLGGKPQDALSQTSVWLTMMVENSARNNGVEIGDDVVFHAGRELFEQLAEASSAARGKEFTEGELQGAWYNALDMYREANTGDGGRFNPEEAATQFAALNEADKEGRADEILPGFSTLPQQAFKGVKVEGEEEEVM